MTATVIGGGLAGAEAAWQLAKRGVAVTLYEMKRVRPLPVYHLDGLCELVCSNSLKSVELTNASGLLKEEMRRVGSVVMECADSARVPAGGALAVDRGVFSEWVTKRVSEHPLIQIKWEECAQIPDNCVVASGPLTEGALAEAIERLCGETLYFYDAAAPIVTLSSIDMSRCFRAARYGRGDADYINCPMTEQEYRAFYVALIAAERAPLHEQDKPLKLFEGCMPIEQMAARGEQTPLFGPLKPVGLPDPATGRVPFAVVQLRQDNLEGTLYNLVGFQTNLKWGEQKRVFSMIPALKDAEFVRYGVMHRNTYINSPKTLTRHFNMRNHPGVFFAGQITGVEGYVESAASGMMAGINLAGRIKGRGMAEFPQTTVMGALSHYISGGALGAFQPMSANFGILPALETRMRGKKERNQLLAKRALDALSLDY